MVADANLYHQFDEPFTLLNFLKVLIPEYDDSLNRLKTPAQLRQFLLKTPKLQEYSTLFNHPDFENRWEQLYGHCQGISSTTMKDAAHDMKQFLEEKNWAIQYFGNYPRKPPKVMEILAAVNCDPSEQALKDFEAACNDYKRFGDELRQLQKQERSYTVHQRNFLSKRISLCKQYLAKLEKNAVPRQLEKRKPSEEPQVESPPAKKQRLVAVDFFKLLNSKIPKDEQYEKFSYLSKDERTIYDEMEKRQEELAELLNNV